jgi:hypothetical protein
MITVEKLKNMDLGFKIGSEYEVFKKGKRSKGDDNIAKGVFIGQSGINNEFLIFISKVGIKECFLKIDIVMEEYKFKKI